MMSRRTTVFLFLIMLTLISTTYADCIGYNETFYARVLDAKNRPVPGAEAFIKYDRGATFGSQYFTTPPLKTDSNGMVQFEIANQGTTSRSIDCNIIATGVAGTINSSVTVIAEKHPSIVDVILPIYPVQIFTRDQLGSPIANATIIIQDDLRKSGSDGRLFYYFKTGPYDYFASYKDGKASGGFVVAGDSFFEIIFTFHRITIDVVDDANQPLNATLSIFNQTFIMENGHFEENKSFGDLIHYSVMYNGIVSEGEIEPTVESSKKIIFDIHSPLIGDVVSEPNNNRPKLVITVSDPGIYASGVDFKSASVQYRLEPADISTPWNNAVTFTSGRGTITAEFPEMPPSRIVEFRISIKDKSGNRASLEGKFSTMVNNTQNNTTNETKPPVDGQENQGIPLIYILIGVIIVILIAYAVFRLRAGGEKSA
jgi:hypothetical protein